MQRISNRLMDWQRVRTRDEDRVTSEMLFKGRDHDLRKIVEDGTAFALVPTDQFVIVGQGTKNPTIAQVWTLA